MNWLNSLLRKPPPPAPARATTRQAAPAAPPVDTAALREALDGAVDEADRVRREAALGRALGASLQAPLAGDAAGIWTAAISHCADKTVALAWLDQVVGGANFAQIARDGRYAEVRLAAAQRVSDSATLETIARASKNRDKGVYRHCSDLLRARREGQERAEQAARIAQDLRRLLGLAPLSVSHLLETERAWKALAGAAAKADTMPASPRVPESPDVFQECRDLLAQADARILEEAQAQRALQALAAGHDALAAQIGAADWPEAAAVTEWRRRRDTLAATLAGLPAWLAGSGTAQAVDAGLQSLGARLDAWSADQEKLLVLDKFLAGIVTGTPPDAQTVMAWEGLPKPEYEPLRREVIERWGKLAGPAAPDTLAAAPPAVEHAEPPPPEPGPQMTGADLDALRAQLEQLELALEAGQLAQADAAARLAKATQGNVNLEGALDARMQRATARLGELRGWAQWGATKKREDLIEAAHQLRGSVATGTHSVEHLAVAIPALREEWKRLNAQGPASKGQWESFDRALEAAYVPVAAFHAQESERRSQARALRESLLMQWEAAVAAIDWQQPDSAAVDALRDSMLGQWRSAPHAGYRDERLMRTRLDALVRTLDERLEAARSIEIQRRESLIGAVAALADVADPRQAGTQAKALQERWRTEAGPMRLRRGEEQKLWQRFRAACDVVFARRDAERAAQTAQRQEKVMARAALLEAFAAFIEAAGAMDAAAGSAEASTLRGADGATVSAGSGKIDPAVAATKRAIAQFRSDWEAANALANDDVAPTAGQERQARELLQKAHQRVAQLQNAALHARYAVLAQAAAVPGDLAPALLEKGRAHREEILIDLEIALGLATPGAGAEIRRRRQLEKLQNRFRAGPAAAPANHDPDTLLAQWYGTAAAPDAAQSERIAGVVHALIERHRAELARSDAEPARRDHGDGRPRPNPAARVGLRPGIRPEARGRR